MVTKRCPSSGPAILLAGALFFGPLPTAGPSALGGPSPASRTASPVPTRQDPSSAADIGFATAEQRSRWRLRGDGYELGFDSQETRNGGPSLRLALAPGAVYLDGGVAVATVHLAAAEARGRRLRLTAWIKSSTIGRGWAGLWARVDGSGGVLAFDNMGDRGVHGTTAWSHVEVDLNVPPEAAAIALGALLAGDGAAWVSDLTLALEPLSQVVAGKVVDPSGRPVNGALVAAIMADAGKPAAVVRTGRDGIFRAVVPAGAVSLTATASGLAAAFQPPTDAHNDGSQDVTLKLGEGGQPLLGELKAVGGLPPAGSRVALARFVEDGGGSFYGELDGAGHFAVRLPPGGYWITLDGSDYALRPSVVQLARDGRDQRVILTASRLLPVPDDVVSWLRLHVAPLRTAAPDQGLEDLRPLPSMLGNARIVALGEATHGTREFFLLKHRLLEFLVSEMGFTVFAIEANWPESLAIDDYVVHGKGDPAQALAGLFFVWNTEEVLDMIRWMRAFNADPAHIRKVRFLGFDMQSARVASHRVAAYLEKVDPPFARKMARSLAAFPDDPHRAARAASVAARVTARALVKRLDARKYAYAARSSQAEWELVRQHAAILEQSAELATPQQPDYRDRAMAQNVGWILAHQPPGARIVLWAHNVHVSYGRDTGGYTPMGEFLRQMFGSDYTNIGFMFDHGAFQAIRPAAQGFMGLHEFTVDPSPIDSLPAAFHRAGFPLALLDLRTCPTTGPIGTWLSAPHAVREAGAIFLGEPQMWMIPTAITKRFDALLYVDRTTRARPALPGAQSTGTGTSDSIPSDSR